MLPFTAVKFMLQAAEESSNLPSAFVSTNDLITSSYLETSNCDLGLMAINYRNRKEGLTDILAGGWYNAFWPS